ncbi:MAG: immunoglobulin-like domain-containing protein [Chloroflexota bacterium]
MREKMKWILPSVLLLLLVVGFGQQIPEVEAQTETVLYRVNVGGPQIAAADGSAPDWGKDQNNFGNANNSPYLVANSTGGSTYTGNAGSAHPGPIVIDSVNHPLPASVPTAVFNTERYDQGSAPEMKWEFPVTSGNRYEVRLYFAELFGQLNAAGQRVFDVTVEGAVPQAFDGVDPFAISGPKGAFVRSMTIVMTDDTLDIEFIHVIENPALKGIEIIELLPTTETGTTAPVISLNGLSSIVLNDGDTYIEAGATATDDVDDDISDNIIIDNSAVDTDTPGIYLVTYNVSDAAGNVATEVTRTVEVLDITPPVIELLGDDPLELSVDDPYTELGATATDDADGDISGNIIVDASAVNTAVASTYEVTYNVSDAAGNAATEVVRDVIVSATLDTTPPVIALLGDNPLVIEQGNAYIEPNATANDDIDGDISGSIVIDDSDVDTSTIGNYQVTYNVSDAAGNAATEVVRDVSVVAPAPVELANFCINIGGTEYTAFGRTFLADNNGGTNSPYFTAGGQKFGSPGNNNTQGLITTLTNVDLTNVEENIFQTERFGGINNGTMTLNLGANGNLTSILGNDGSFPNGEYIVDLYFAEVFVGVQNTDGAGARVFDVTVEGELFLDDLDLFAVAGNAPLKAFVSSTYTQVSDNTLTIDFSASADNAKISAICVTPLAEVEADNTVPFINLIGDEQVQLTVGDTYTELGATAEDDADGDINLRVFVIDLELSVLDPQPVNTDVPGLYTVTYIVTDRNGNDNFVNRFVTVNAPNTPPVASDDTATAFVNISATISVLSNDSDTEDSTPTVNSATNGTSGTTTVNNDGTITYVPATDFTGTDSFTYEVVDSNGATDTATVTVTVNPVPVAVDDAITIPVNSAQVTIDLFANDLNIGLNSTSALISETEKNGFLVPNLDGTFLYTPDTDFTGEDTILYAVREVYDGGIYTSNTGTITITVEAPVNEAPVAVDDTATTNEDTAINIDVLGNDTDADDDTITIIATSNGPLSGQVAIEENGSITYTPDADFNGSDSFGYEIIDGNDGEDIGMVTVTVEPVNDDPVVTITAPSDQAEFTVGEQIDFVATASDVEDGDIASSIAWTSDLDGSLGSTGTIEIGLTVGIHTITASVTDSDGVTVQDSITITVSEPPPVELANFCLNIGGPQFDAFGRTFLADNNGQATSPYFTSGGTKFNSGQAVTEDMVALANDALSVNEIDIFQSERFGGAPPVTNIMTLDLGIANNLAGITTDGSLPNGDYTIDLYFAEIFVGVQQSGATKGAGDRVFNVSIEGTQVLTDYDLFALYGPLTAVVETFDVTVADNSLTVDFNAGVDNAKLSAICVRPNDDTDQTAPTITLLGDPTIELTVGDTYVEAGATATDNTSGDMNLRVVVDASAVNTATPGNYQVTYDAVDGNGNSATQVIRTVNVTALNTAPTIAPIADVTLDEGQDVVVDVIVTDNEADATVSLLIDGVDPSAYTFENNTLTWLTPPAGEFSATVTADDGEFSATEAFTITINEVIVGVPSALVEITPDDGLGASTYSGSSFQITNNSTAGITIDSVTFDLSTGILPDMVFDPVGAGGDATSSCLIPNSGATATGFVTPTDPCVDPFSVPRNGGFDVMTINFTDFGETEQFFFTTDIDPNSIQGVPGAGNAGAVSGYELVGSTITVTFSDGSTIVSSLYEDGSIGGAQAVVTTNATSAPSIVADGVTSPAIVNDLNQTIVLTGTPGDNYSLLQMDTRLYIASGNPPFDVTPTELPFYANEAMAGKNVLNGVIDGDGTVEIPVTLLTTAGASGTPDGGLNYFIAVTSSAPYAVDQQVSQTSNTIILKYEEGIPEALVEITPTGNLGASTFSASSFQITNNSTAGITIDSVTFDLSTGILPDMVFDPVGAGGDATASCLTPNSGATATGFIVPTDPCVDPFSVPRNGGFDVMTVDFSDFGAGEEFLFTTDVDPNSIQGVPGAGNAGAVSGYELSGATITVTFSNGAVITSSLYEMGNLSGAQAVVANGATTAPSIAADGVTSPAIVNDLNQTIVLTGTPGDYYSLLQMDTRLFIASGNPPFDVTPQELPFYANEAMAGKNVLNGVIDGDGTVEIPVTLLTTVGASGTPDGGLNYFIAVTSSAPYAVDQQVSQTSNTVILKYEEAPSNVAPEIIFLTPVTNGISVQETQSTAVQLSVTDADGNLDIVDVTGTTSDFASVSGGTNGVYTITFTPDMDDSGIYTVTVVATDTEGASASESFILTVTEEPMATLVGTFTMQGRSDLSTSGLTVTMYSVDGVEEYSFAPTVSANGEFTLTGINPGTYQVMLDTSVSLQLVEVVTVTAGNNTVAMGQLRVGDANGDNVVSSLDFSLLATSFNTQQGGAGYNAGADFNGDGFVTSLDFSLLASNFNTAGEEVSIAP